MHDYLFSIEVVRFAFVAGVVVSMLLYERRHLTTGSIVVPGYIAIFLVQPAVLAATFANAFLAFWFVNRLLPRWVLVYGRTKFAVLVITSTIVQSVLLELSPSGSHLWEADIPLLVGAGYVVPALIAHDMARQGIGKTLRTVVVAGLLVAAPIGLTMLFEMPGVNELVPLTGFGVSAIGPSWVPLAVLMSVAAAWGLQSNHRLRSGGFVGAAYVGMLSAAPAQVFYLVGVGWVTYLVVTRLLMPWMILFGRRKFATMLLVASVLSWSGMLAGQHLLGLELSYYMTLSSVALMPLFVPGLIANDMERSGPVRVVAGLVLGGVFVVAATWVAQDVFEHLIISVPWVVTALVTGGIVFSGQVRFVGEFVCARLGIATEVDQAVSSRAPATSRPSSPTGRTPSRVHEGEPVPVPWSAGSGREEFRPLPSCTTVSPRA